MTVTYQVEKFDDVYDEAYNLLQRHYDEITEDKDILGKLDPDIGMYQLIEKLGLFHVITARVNNTLVGYFSIMVKNHLHYKTVKVGCDDIYFIAPEHRNGRIGYGLFKFTLNYFKELGCELVTLRTKIAHDNDALLKRLEMRPFERSYIRRM